MVLQLASEVVWSSLKQELFAVLGMVTEKGEARTVGVVYIVYEHRLYVVTGKDTWKARHMTQNAHVSVTVPIAKRIPFLFWIKIPAATITFSGQATVQSAASVSKDVLKSLLRTENPDNLNDMCVIEIQPVGDFVTYGIGVPLMSMRTPEQARGRAPVA
ncbi:MAG: pyridoxamine 5'-phosphate oxidase family protein [Chloroflexi bacterium]|nr:pyridoxamine 5'-phosphate oxidase family protein [Chloroflexota bacterium]